MSKRTIGAQIKAIRIAMGISQDAFATLFNEGQDPTIATTRNDIAKYELGINSVPAEKYVRFLELENTYINAPTPGEYETPEEVEAKLKAAGVADTDNIKGTDMPMGL